jgi:hypothetical protein
MDGGIRIIPAVSGATETRHVKPHSQAFVGGGGGRNQRRALDDIRRKIFV